MRVKESPVHRFVLKRKVRDLMVRVKWGKAGCGGFIEETYLYFR
jgi:hypothetical protein